MHDEGAFTAWSLEASSTYYNRKLRFHAHPIHGQTTNSSKTLDIHIDGYVESSESEEEWGNMCPRNRDGAGKHTAAFQNCDDDGGWSSRESSSRSSFSSAGGSTASDCLRDATKLRVIRGNSECCVTGILDCAGSRVFRLSASARYSWDFRPDHAIRAERPLADDNVCSSGLNTANACFARESSQHRSGQSHRGDGLRCNRRGTSRIADYQRARCALSERSKSVDFGEDSFQTPLERCEVVTRNMLKFLSSSPTLPPTHGTPRRWITPVTRRHRLCHSSSSSRRRRSSNTTNGCPAPRMPRVASVPALSCLDSPSPSSRARPKRHGKDPQPRRQSHHQCTSSTTGSLTPPSMSVLPRQQNAFAAGEAFCKQLEARGQLPEEPLRQRRTEKRHGACDLQSRSFPVGSRKQGPTDGKNTPALHELPSLRLRHLTASECSTRNASG